MACGCPVAASNAGALPEVLGDAARTFDPTDAAAIAACVAEVLDSPGPFVERGLERARSFTWDECARRHDDVYSRAQRLLIQKAPGIESSRQAGTRSRRLLLALARERVECAGDLELFVQAEERLQQVLLGPVEPVILGPGTRVLPRQEDVVEMDDGLRA